MITGDLRSKIDNVWNAFWAGGIANPIEVIERITYLLFIRGLDEAHARGVNKTTRLKRPMERHIFPGGKDDIGAVSGIAYHRARKQNGANCLGAARPQRSLPSSRCSRYVSDKSVRLSKE